MNKIFDGPNGHYVAWEDDSGTHYQPQNGCNGWWSEVRKKRELAEANESAEQDALETRK